jgi:uncharacterized protein YceH (UPF0502 family)
MNEADQQMNAEEEQEESTRSMELDPSELRVLGCLIEKEITTPEYYPLTLKALTAACNQKSNREPVMSLDEAEVIDALEKLRYRHRLAWEVAQAGSRTPKYKHSLLNTLELKPRQLAVICELILRGPQTQGELRAHCARLADFDSLAEVRQTISELEQWPGGALVDKLPPGSGRRELRYIHLLGKPENRIETDEPASRVVESEGTGLAQNDSRIEELETRVSDIYEELNQLRTQFHEFKKQFE